MTARLRNVLTSTATCLFVAVTGCSTGSTNPPQTQGEGSGDVAAGTGASSGAESGATTATGSSGTTTATGSSGTTTATGSSGTTPTSGATTGSGSGSSGTAGSGSASGTGTSGSASGATSGSASGASGTAAAGPGFAEDVYNNLGLCTTCLPCHSPPSGGGYVNGKLDLSTSSNAYTNLVGVKAAGSACGTSGLTRVVAGSAATSLLYNKLNAKTTAGAKAPCGNGMPETGTPLSTSDLMVVEMWINSGAAP
jgi:hypothetical protein